MKLSKTSVILCCRHRVRLKRESPKFHFGWVAKFTVRPRMVCVQLVTVAAYSWLWHVPTRSVLSVSVARHPRNPWSLSLPRYETHCCASSQLCPFWNISTILVLGFHSQPLHVAAMAMPEPIGTSSSLMFRCTDMSSSAKKRVSSPLNGPRYGK